MHSHHDFTLHSSSYCKVALPFLHIGEFLNFGYKEAANDQSANDQSANDQSANDQSWALDKGDLTYFYLIFYTVIKTNSFNSVLLGSHKTGQSAPCCSSFLLLPVPFILLPAPFILLPAPFILLPAPFILLPAPFIILPAPFILPPTPFIPLPTPFYCFLLLIFSYDSVTEKCWISWFDEHHIYYAISFFHHDFSASLLLFSTII